MTARNEDFLFAQEAQNLGYVSEEQVEEGFLLQRRMAEDLKIDERLAVILVKRGWLAEEQARRVYGIIEPEGARSEIEGYRLVEKIGRGAMGTVYKAIHKGLHRVVAIKILRRDLAADKTQIERLKREAKLLADLDHNNVVRAFDAGESNGFPFLVMEYVEGETLRDRITRRGALSNEEALRITRALADALERARRMGVVHRDVKPGNILLSKSGTPKLMDLGLAKGPLDLGLTQHGATVGTPQFISPEQAQDPRKADTRSDIYSLGATLYAMVTTRPPFEGATLAEIITKVLYQQPTPARLRNRDVSPEIAHLIERMMLKDPSLRYQTPAQVVADIDMIRGGQSIVPKGFRGNWEAYLLRQRQRKWLRRGVVGLAAAVVLGVGGYTWVRRAARERAQTEVDTLASRVLELPPVGSGTTATEIQGWLAEASRLRDEIDECEREGGVSCGRKVAVVERLRSYRETLRVLDALENEGKSVEVAVRRGEFGAALERIALHVERTAGCPPAEVLRAKLLRGVREASDAHWGARQEAVLGRTAGDLAGFTAKWVSYKAALLGDYARTAKWQKAQERASRLAAAAGAIHREVREVEVAFGGEALQRRIAALELFYLKNDLHERRRAVLTAVEGHWQAFLQDDVVSVPRSLLVGENGYVPRALDRIENEIDRQVEAYWQQLQAEVVDIEVDAALERLKAFEDATARGSYYLELSRQAAQLADSIDAARAQRMRAAEAAFDVARAAVLRALRRGDPDAVRRAVATALADPDLDHRRRTAVEALGAAAEALEELQSLAALYLQSAPPGGLRDVRLRAPDGSEFVDERWTDVEVTLPRGPVRTRVRRDGSRRQEITVPLRDVTLAQLRAWANRSGEALRPRTLALVELAVLRPVHDDPGVDLRELLKRYERVRARFERLDPDSAYAAMLAHLAARLEQNQENREVTADATLTRAEYFVLQGKYLLGLDYLDLLTAQQGKLRFTRVYDQNREKIAVYGKTCRDELAREELLRLLPGAIPKPLDGGRHRFLFDMDDALQLDNFDRGFGVLEPHGSAVTPLGPEEQRLVLLKGAEGLVRDRPLSLPTMFDPAEKIVLEVTIWTLGGSFLLAFDIDGVQIAICSADPNIWKWRLPPGAPLIEDEDELPAFDFYGRGRGIAFNAGKHFGESFPLGNWEWPAFGRGRHFERWQDEKFLEDRRDTLFAFEPRRKYRVRLVRNRGELQLWVDGEEIVRKADSSWEQRGDHSELDKRIRHGSGRIQILTWTPMAIDDLTLEGRVMDRWRRLQKQRQQEEKK